MGIITWPAEVGIVQSSAGGALTGVGRAHSATCRHGVGLTATRVTPTTRLTDTNFPMGKQQVKVSIHI